MKKVRLLLIHGFFFQEQAIFGTAHDPIIGVRVTTADAVVHTHFSGLISTTNNEGQLSDEYGVSIISDIVFDEENGTLSFIKKYTKRNDTISYQLTKQAESEEWTGSFTGSYTGNGTVKCFINVIDETFITEIVN